MGIKTDWQTQRRKKPTQDNMSDWHKTWKTDALCGRQTRSRRLTHGVTDRQTEWQTYMNDREKHRATARHNSYKHSDWWTDLWSVRHGVEDWHIEWQIDKGVIDRQIKWQTDAMSRRQINSIGDRRKHEVIDRQSDRQKTWRDRHSQWMIDTPRFNRHTHKVTHRQIIKVTNRQIH